MLPIDKIMESLSKKRSIFHSEADFQHALAWELHEKWCKKASIRLEYKVGEEGERKYVDIWVKGDKYTYAIELKYKTKSCIIREKGEEYNLLNQSAQDIGRYDYLKDVQRLEQIRAKRGKVIGYAIFLTNDRLYWDEPKRSGTVDEMFRIHHGRKLQGMLKWGPRASKGTMKGRIPAIVIRNNCLLKWADYGKGNISEEFKYLLVTV